MTNYDLEEAELITFQIALSVILLFTTIISISLSYDYLLKIKKEKPLYSEKEASDILVFNRLIMFIVSLLFLYINVRDQDVKEKEGSQDRFSSLQIIASILSLSSAIIVLYVGVLSVNNIVSEENPTI